MTAKEKLDKSAYHAAWLVVYFVESGQVKDMQSINFAASFLEAYADLYENENCRYRAQKLKNQTN